MTDSRRYHYQFQIVLTGEIAVGKTSMVHNFVGKMDEKQVPVVPTIGIEGYQKQIQVNDQRFNLLIGDVGGTERMSSSGGAFKSYFGNIAGAMLVFDITNRKSFYETIKWMDEVNRAATANTPFFLLVGNKIDKSVYTSRRPAIDMKNFYQSTHNKVSSDDGEVTTVEAHAMANAYKMEYIETYTIVQSTNSSDAFFLLARKIYEALQDRKIKLYDGWYGVLTYDSVVFLRKQQEDKEKQEEKLQQQLRKLQMK